jgi:hypothetical protein
MSQNKAARHKFSRRSALIAPPLLAVALAAAPWPAPWSAPSPAPSARAVAAAAAADWVERPFDPPPGSRWALKTSETSEDNSDGHIDTSVLTTTSELIIEQKTADGFRVSYVLRDAAFQGDSQRASVVDPVTHAMQNLVIEATLAPNGKPLRVENLDDLVAKVRSRIDAIGATSGDTPQSGFLREVATRMLVADAAHAPNVYLANLATLAVGQDTGLHPGETRNSNDDIINPFNGTPIKSNTTLAIDSADPATGDVRYVRTQSFDSDAIKTLLGKLAEHAADADAAAAAGAGSPGGTGDAAKDRQSKIDAFLSKAAMTLDSRTEFEVEDGMTRTLRQEDKANAAIPGHSIVKHGHKLMTLTREP